jgi:DNA polymerase V
VGYSQDEFGGGFHRSRTIMQPTNVTMELYRVCLQLFKEHYSGKTVRQISIAIGNIVDDWELQLDLFDMGASKRRELGYVVDSIRRRFGSGSLLRAVSYTSAGTAKHRATLVGGHKM